MTLHDHRGTTATLIAFVLLWFGDSLRLSAAPVSIMPKRGGTLRLAIEMDPRSMDPAPSFLARELMLSRFVFNTLLDTDDNGRLIPDLADALPLSSPDGLTHTIRLRRGVLFSDGHELTADDVQFTLERLLDPTTGAGSTSYRGIRGAAAFEQARTKEANSAAGSPHGRTGRWIEPVALPGVVALDRHTVQIQIDRPDPTFHYALSFSTAAVVPRHYVERMGRRFATAPLGTGPYILKDWQRGVRMRFERNPRYFQKGEPGPDGVEVLLNMDVFTQGMMFERGEIDFLCSLTDPDLLRFQRDSRLRPTLEIVEGASPVFIALNCELSPFTNRIVRQALNYAVDKAALAKLLLHRGVPAQGPLPLVISGFNQGLAGYPHDPAKARALLAEAGFSEGFETTLLAVRDDPAYMKLALFVQQALRDVGVRVHLREVSGPVSWDLAGRRRAVPMSVTDWAAGFDDPKETLDPLFSGSFITEEASSNKAFYSSPATDQLFEAATNERDLERRLRIYHEIERLVVEDAPWIFLIHLNTETACQPWLKGFHLRRFFPPIRLENCWIER